MSISSRVSWVSPLTRHFCCSCFGFASSVSEVVINWRHKILIFNWEFMVWSGPRDTWGGHAVDAAKGSQHQDWFERVRTVDGRVKKPINKLASNPQHAAAWRSESVGRPLPSKMAWYQVVNYGRIRLANSEIFSRQYLTTLFIVTVCS